jgi:catechol 2,3-dioxygenase-like lactoylglutathione lyase family enzyme
MASISGVGALIIYANEPAELAEWYRGKLGFNFQHNDQDGRYYGELYDPATKQGVYLALYPTAETLPYGNHGVMVNYRVSDFDAFIKKLEGGGVSIDDRRGNGASKFVTITDPEGNPIELWSGV